MSFRLAKIDKRITKLMNTFLEVLKSKSYDEWEDSFRRDEHPEKELQIWEFIAEKYLQFAPKYNSII